MKERATADYWREVKEKDKKRQRRHCVDEPSTSTTRLRAKEPALTTLEMARARTRLAELSESR